MIASLACVATNTHRARAEDNQDAALVAALSPGGLPALVVADGLGSFAHAGEAARFVVAETRRILESPANGRPRGFPDLFPLVQERLAAHARTQEHSPASVADPTQAWGTTLLVAIETPDSLLVAYAGNGGLFHLRGDFADWGAHAALPWSFVNYLNPHSVEENGREALYRFVSASGSPEQADPTVLSIRKDKRFGELLLVCTDGIYSPDQVRHGNPGDGSVWGEVSPPLIALHTALRAGFNAPGDLSQDGLQQTMDGCLTGLRESRTLDDDATLGLLVTSTALAYRREQQEKCGAQCAREVARNGDAR